MSARGRTLQALGPLWEKLCWTNEAEQSGKPGSGLRSSVRWLMKQTKCMELMFVGCLGPLCRLLLQGSLCGCFRLWQERGPAHTGLRGQWAAGRALWFLPPLGHLDLTKTRWKLSSELHGSPKSAGRFCSLQTWLNCGIIC